MYKLIITIILSFTLLSSCETLVSEVPPSVANLNEEQLAISCFLSPQDTLISVLVTLSNPLFSERKTLTRGFSTNGIDTTFFSKSAIIQQATVVLKSLDTDDEITLAYDPNYQAYVYRPFEEGSTFRVRQGNYELSVTHEDMKATATTEVPRRRNDFFRVLNTTDFTTFGFGGDSSSVIRLTAQVGWTYSKNESAYFRIRGGVFYLSEQLNRPSNSDFRDPPLFEKVRRMNVISFSNGGVFDGSALETSDTPQIAGQTFITRFHRNLEGNFGSETLIESVHVDLLTISEDYFKFYESYSQNVEANPFIEPTSIFSNVKGGLGIFAGSNGVKEVEIYDTEDPIE